MTSGLRSQGGVGPVEGNAMPASRRRVRARVITTDRLRFAAGWRLSTDPLTEIAPGLTADIPPSIVVDLVRSADLVAIIVEGYDVELVAGTDPHLRTVAGGTGRIVARFAYQHLGERALYEGAAPIPDPVGPEQGSADDFQAIDGPDARHIAPIQALPARGSRIVLAMAEGVTIPFSSEGILAALTRLPMIVHPLATPRSGVVAVPPVGSVPPITLPGGLIASRGSRGVIISPAPRSVATRAPDPATVRGVAELARHAREARRLLATATGIGVRLDVGDVGPGTPGRAVVEPGLVVPDPRIVIRPRAQLSRDVEPFETAIEAPFRLTISPSEQGGWAHATRPVGAGDAAHRIELWHTRLGVRSAPPDHAAPASDHTSSGSIDPDETPSSVERLVDERDHPQRIVRALWTRDRERFPGWAGDGQEPTHDDQPFRMSLTAADRHMLVRQSAETWVVRRSMLRPAPVDVEALWLSSLGAWLDLHGDWDTTPYSAVGMPSILTWDHVAPMGRDQFVRVVYPGYLFPFGHRATLVKLTERKMTDASPSVAGLYQRKFLVVNEPVRSYGANDLPFTEVRVSPLVTPTLSPDPGELQDSCFFPFVDDLPFRFVLHCLDREHREVRLVAPLLWVAEHFHEAQAIRDTYRGQPPVPMPTPFEPHVVPVGGRNIAFAPVAVGGDTVLPVTSLTFDGEPHPQGSVALGTSRPFLERSKVRVPAAEHLAPIGEQTIRYFETYLQHGFGGAANSGEVWARLDGASVRLAFGASSGAASDKAGGFLSPSLAVEGLSRSNGIVSELAATAQSTFAPGQYFAPGKFLSDQLPKLFGLIPLADLLSTVGVDLDDAPQVVSEALDRIEGFLADLEQVRRTVIDAVNDAQLVLQRAQENASSLIAEGRQQLADELVQKAQSSFDTAQNLQATVVAAVDTMVSTVSSLLGASEIEVESALQTPRTALEGALVEIRSAVGDLPPMVARRLGALADVLDAILASADLIDDVVRFVHGLATSAVEGRFSYEWRPKLANWPQGTDPILEVPERGLRLAVDGRVAGSGPPSVDVVAELRDFTLNLLPGETLVRFRFDHLMFRSGSSGKAEVDVVMNDIEFVGLLGFVETLKELVPFDGFSDPPYVDVSPSGLDAGFTLALPNVAIGVFSLSNISLGADVRVPFLGDVVTVGFNFCTRERPFTLSVTFIGGGGWFLLRLSPDGLDVLELGLEAGATLSIDLGVASGSVSVMIGVYMRLEGDAGSLTAYFRLRGEVDVLGLISASIELYLALTYHFATGKLIGTATITVKVSVLCFSGTVKISCERKFAGSNGDPGFAEIMGVAPDGTSAAWTEYCQAFAGA
jgi:hypothetical protein